MFDFEAMLPSIHDKTSDKYARTAENIHLSVSICSFVEELESPHCIVNPDTTDLVLASIV